MKQRVARHRDISVIMLVASAAVIAYALFGALLLSQEETGKIFSETPSTVSTNL